MVHVAETMEGDKGGSQWRVIKVVHIAETMEGQHGGLVLSVDALTKTVYIICVATPRFLTHTIFLVLT